MKKESKKATMFELTTIEKSFRGTDAWFPTGQRDHDNRTIFIHRSIGRKAVVGDDDEMQVIKEKE